MAAGGERSTSHSMRTTFSPLVHRVRISRTDRAEAAEYRQLLAARLRFLVPVDQPLVLVTQIPRSGGTLLMRLFDGHPECHTISHQLSSMLHGLKGSFDEPAAVWERLASRHQEARFRRGHPQNANAISPHLERLPFLLPPRLQRAIFDACAAELERPSPRRLVDAYLTSYFNAWLDNRNLHTGVPKRWVTGFEPNKIAKPRYRRIVREIYPDGRVISVVRDPLTWYASMRRWKRQRPLEEWCQAAREALVWQAELGDAFRLIAFEDLLRHTEGTMQSLADWLGIACASSLLVPSFNGIPIVANSSFSDVTTEVSTAPLERAREELGKEETAYVLEHAGELNEQVSAAVHRPAPA